MIKRHMIFFAIGGFVLWTYIILPFGVLHQPISQLTNFFGF